MYEHKNILEPDLQVFKPSDFKSKSNHAESKELTECCLHLPALQDVHILCSLCTASAELAELQACFMLAKSYKHFKLQTDKCGNVQPHSWETDDPAGALARTQVPHYFYHDSSGNF